ncbi:ArsR/SmtB family transcription factor [Bdellovibrio bacteriovorus]|uniref:ArsR/SmtB family transcription factor n=1 Tax=Bdellovibrio TaxID=958 RepID=UPI0035A84386
MNTQTNAESRSLIFEHLGEIAQALASPARLRIIQHLTNRPSHVEEISQFIGQPIGSASQHLQKLKQVGLVSIEKQGTSRLYRLANPKVVEAWLALQNLAAEVDPMIREEEEKIAPSEVCASCDIEDVIEQVQNKKAVLIDVRSLADAESTPVKGAIHIPAEGILAKAGDLPKSKTIYLFCRGRYCERATTAVLALRKKGFKAYRLKANCIQIGTSLQ